MNRPRFRVPALSKIVAVVAIAVGGAVAFALPAGADVSSLSPAIGGVRIESPAVLEARGAAVTVSVTIVCAPGASGGLSLEVAQRVGSEVTHGFNSMQLPPCTGSFQNLSISVTAQDRAFRKGTAFASASMFLCDFTGCRNLQDQREIAIVR
jgi:hypothetical protein